MADSPPHQGGSSQSILISESPDSPFLVTSPPARDSEIYTQQDHGPMGARVSTEDSNDSLATGPYDIEIISSGNSNLGQWLGNNSIETNSTHPLSSLTSNDSSSSSGYIIETIDEETNISSPAPDTRVRKSEDHDDEPPAKVRKVPSPKNEDTDGETCPICFDIWGNSGEHRLVSLKCGHLFGSKCVERWLKAQTLKERSCPTCKSKAAVRDIRLIYARKLVAADKTEVTALQNQVYLLQAEKSKAELELQRTKTAYVTCLKQLETLRSSMTPNSRETVKRKNWRLSLEKNLELSKHADSRVLAYNCRTYELYASQKSNNNLFPGYGIRKINSVDFKLGQFLHLHSKPIRDITYSQSLGSLLSVSLDGFAKIVDNGIVTTTINAGVPLWSCTWDSLRSNEIYLGSVGGYVQQYDIRNPSTCIQRLNTPTDVSPVISLCSTEYGLLSCHLNSLWLWTADSVGQWEPNALPLVGPFMSMCYDKESHRILVCGRSKANSAERSKLTLCKLHVSLPDREITCNIEHTFPGSTWTSVMTRSTFYNTLGSTWAVSYAECEALLALHGVANCDSLKSPIIEPALDLCTFEINGSNLLAALSKTRLRVYKVVLTS